ncbi:hypothetical protein [Sulfuracidifex tepidarius]|nr:hypothetical protein [Sulfuracidifex tepidarius]
MEALSYFMKGQNPYLGLYYPVDARPTYTIYGTVVHNFVYPPLSFLIYLPIALLLSLSKLPLYYSNVVNILFQDALVFLIFRAGLKREDPIATLPVIFLFIIADVEVPGFSGVSASVWGTFLAISYLYDDKRSGIALALANSFSQISWLITPFLLLYKFRTSRGTFFTNLKWFLGTLTGVFLPFMLWSPEAFLHIFTTDLNTIPVGFTGMTLLNFTGIFEVEPWYFTIMMGAIGLFSLYLYYKAFKTLRETLWIYPMLVMWFSWRTLTEYFMIWPMLMFLSVFRLYDFSTVQTNFPEIRLPKKEIGTIFLLLFTVAGSLGVIAHTQYVSQDPLRIVSVSLDSKGSPIYSLNITVENIGKSSTNITLVRVSVPDHLNMVWNYSPNYPIKPGSNATIKAYTDQHALEINGSCITVQVYSSYYISEYKLNLTSINMSTSSNIS